MTASAPKHRLRPIAWIMAPPGEAIYSDAVTRIEIDDVGAGEFIILKQITDNSEEVVRFNRNEIEHLMLALRTAHRHLIQEFTENEARP